MLDFVTIKHTETRKGISVYPEFGVSKSNDLMIRGKAFYAIWDERIGMWNTNEIAVVELVDGMIFDYAEKHFGSELRGVQLQLLKNFSSNKWMEFQKYCKSFPDNWHDLDVKITFSNTAIKKKDYVTKRLDYPLEDCATPAYEELMSTLYLEEERQKLEWATGSIISGASRIIQKFIVLYGAPGSGKSTFLNILQKMFDGYYGVFESKALAGNSNAFALEAFRSNPLIAIQHDGDLSKIEDNTKLNSIVSHEIMMVNEKFKSAYPIKLQSFLFMGTNKPVKMTDGKSGLIRRLIDVSPSGNKVSRSRYDKLMKQIDFELGGIASHCLKVFEELGPTYYDGYYPMAMFGATNDIFNFIEDNMDLFLNEDEIALRTIWLRYKDYCEDARVPYPMSMRIFKNELMDYFKEFYERKDNKRSVYCGFMKEKFDYTPLCGKFEETSDTWLKINKTESIFDDIFKDYPAQLATEDESQRPIYSWDKCKTKLSDISTTKIHYIRVPENLIVIDFDLKDTTGNKSFELNLKEAEKWPMTYAELSKSEAGIHLHYYYNGDVDELKRIFDENKDIEIKVFKGKSSLRRKLTKCNDIPIATITSGLPKKEAKKFMVSETQLKSEKSLRELIERNLRKEIHPATKPSIDFIFKILEDAYNSDMHYDVTDMRSDVQNFALGSTHNSYYCIQMVSKMHFESEEPSENSDRFREDDPIIFFDCEVFPNLFVICWKIQGEGNQVVKMINPKAEEVEALFKFKLVGFNNRDYDNHILWAAAMGYTPEELYFLSQEIIVKKNKNAKFGEAFNVSYTDIYDFLSAANKMSLKKWEIKLGIHHQECPYEWNKSVPKDKWNEVADYCANDVKATEATFNANQDDWVARQILADWADMTVNDTTNSLTTKIIVGDDPRPWEKYIYTDLSTIYPGYEYNPYGIEVQKYNEGTKIVSGKSIYMGEDPGEGGYVFATPGMHINVVVLDITSMHPHSAIMLKIFGPYTEHFINIVEGRVAVKHKDLELAKRLLPKKVHKYLDDLVSAKGLAGGLKTAINSIYGLTSAKFPNKLKDPRNIDNIVAKYGALFMINLKHEVQKRGFIVAHIKTDSIKIPNATKEIIDFVMDYGKKYGYTFEWESTYSKMCLVNESTYVAEVCQEDGKDVEPYWTATGAQFQVPYVFKKLFSKENIGFDDVCETKSVTTSLYLDMNEDNTEFHNYIFIGKIGLFVPVKDGKNGGILLRKGNEEGKFSAVGGTKKKFAKGEVYRWLEAEQFIKQSLTMEDVDYGYFNDLCTQAIEAIEKFGDFEMFVNEKPIAISYLDDEEFPFSDDCMNVPIAS